MRIAIDGLPLYNPLTGIGHYTLELARHLALVNPEDQVSLVSPRRFVKAARNTKEANLKFARRFSPLMDFWWKSSLPRYLRKNRFHLYHGTNYEFPLKADCPIVVTIHDLSVLFHANTHENRRVVDTQAILREAAKRVARIITPTEAIRREVHEQLSVALDRIVAIPEAAKACFYPDASQAALRARNRLRVGDKFVLYVGTVEPRKNLLTLVKAFEQTVKSLGDSSLQLVIAGRKGWLIQDLFAYAKRSPIAKQIRFTGYLSDDELRALYSACKLFVYPSLYEGFGLPPLEAMSCGAPVIASRIPSITEVVGDAAELIAPTDVEGLADLMGRLLPNEVARCAMSVKGIERASQLSWKRTAEMTRAVYVGVVG